jgi:hypothetical protein
MSECCCRSDVNGCETCLKKGCKVLLIGDPDNRQFIVEDIKDQDGIRVVDIYDPENPQWPGCRLPANLVRKIPHSQSKDSSA